MYIYCDAIEPRVVGDTTAPLLMTLPISIKDFSFGDIVSTRHGNTEFIFGIFQKSSFRSALVIHTRLHIRSKPGAVSTKVALGKKVTVSAGCLVHSHDASFRF